jgi:hypothetical protein
MAVLPDHFQFFRPQRLAMQKFNRHHQRLKICTRLVFGTIMAIPSLF